MPKPTVDNKQQRAQKTVASTKSSPASNDAAKFAVKNNATEPKKAKEKSADSASTSTKEKAKKTKLVRDSFTMPEPEYKLIADVKRDCLKAGIAVKKSELLRVGVAMIRQMEIDQLKAALSALPTLKVGRPKKEK